MTDLRLKVAAMPRASYLEDGTEIQMEFETEDHRSVTLRFTPLLLEEFVSKTMQLVMHVRSQTLSIGDHLATQAVEVVAAMAQAATGGGKVIVGFRGSNGIPQHFSLSPAEAENLRPQLFRAAKSARAQAAKARH